MPFQTGSAANPADLISKLATFAAANGWTVTTLTDTHRVFEKGTVFCGVATSSTTVSLRSCTGVASGSAYTAQPGNSGTTHNCNPGAGPYVSHVFYTGAEAGADYLYAVVEIAAGVFRHIAIGKLVKFGTYTGGEFSDSTWWSTTSNPNIPADGSNRRIFDDGFSGTAGQGFGQVRADIDGKAAPAWSLINSTNARGEALGSAGLHAALFGGVGYQRYNLNTPLFPLYITVDRPSSLRSILGRVPNLRLANLRNLSPGQILNIAGDEWQVWPQAARTDSQGVSGAAQPPASGYFGFAIKRV